MRPGGQKKNQNLSVFKKLFRQRSPLVVNENKNRWRQCFFYSKIEAKIG